MIFPKISGETENKAAAFSVFGTNSRINYSIEKNPLVIFKEALSKKLTGAEKVQAKHLRNFK